LINKPLGLAQGKAKGDDGAILSSMFDHNVTRGALKNLVTDKPAPITNTNLINKPLGLAQGKVKGDDGAILSSMFDHNVTRGALKNLVTDKPSPITNTNLINKPLGLSQQLLQVEKKDNIDHVLNDHNVTNSALKNIVTDKPSPLTVPNLAQKTKQGVPVTVNPSVAKNEMAEAKLGLKMTVGHDPVELKKKQSLSQGVPVLVDPVLMKNEMGNAKFGNKILVGADEIEYKKKHAQKLAQTSNPVENPPYNNWSVNQPSPPHDRGYAGNEDYGQNIIIDGHHVRY
jgi:hypothetical protein